MLCIPSAAHMAAQPPTAKVPIGTMTMLVVDETGQAVPVRLETFAGHSGEMAGHFQELKGTQIPYGYYDYVLRRGGPGNLGENIGGRVELWCPEQTLVVTVKKFFVPGAAMDQAPVPGFVIKGKLQPMLAGQEPLRIRLSPVDQTQQLDVSVDPTGEFRIYRALAGRYVLSVIQGTEILHVQPVWFEENWQPAQFVVNLTENPSVIHVKKK